MEEELLYSSVFENRQNERDNELEEREREREGEENKEKTSRVRERKKVPRYERKIVDEMRETMS